MKSLQWCPTLSDLMDCSLPGSSIHGIFQAGVLEWGAIAFSNNTCQTDNTFDLILFYCRDAARVSGRNQPLVYMYPGEGNGTPLQYFCLENPMDGGAWWAAVHGVAESWARMSNFTFISIHWRRKWQPTPVFLPGESQGQGSLVSCHLWGRTESDTTEAT